MANLYSLPKFCMGFAVSAALVLLLVACFGSASNIERTPLKMIQSVSDSEASTIEPRSGAEPDTMAASRDGSIPTGFHTLSPGQSVTITSQNYPNGYYPREFAKHVWFFRGTCTESTISITCSDFRMHKCLFSKLTISGKDLMETKCRVLPAFTLTSSNNDMRVVFRVRKYLKRKLRGFTCTVSASDSEPVRISSLDSSAAELRNPNSACNCGQPIPAGRIIGGQETTIEEHPWHVGIRLGSNDSSPFCGGVIISDTHILTAAQCIAPFQPGGTINVIFGHREWGQATELSGVIYTFNVHPDYDSETQENDIAVIQMSTPFMPSDMVVPICLPEEGNSYDNVVATVVGWGESQEGGLQSSVLKEVVLPTMTNCYCEKDYGHRVTDDMICAGLKEGGIGACERDAGGALVASGDCEDTFKVLIGIKSWGSCGNPREPGVYTRVSNYLEWIRGITGSSTTCQIHK